VVIISYIKKVLERFNTNKAKPVATPLGNHFKLSSHQSPLTKKEKEEMKKISYSSAVRSLMYAMVCTRLNIGVVSTFLANPEKEHREVVK